MDFTTQHASTNELGAAERPAARKRSGSWLGSLTAVCFIFGMFLALQLRAQQHVVELRASNPTMPAYASQEIQDARKQLEKERVAHAALQAEYNNIVQQMATATTGSKLAASHLKAQMQQLQLVAGLTRVKGPGIVITMSDNPQAAQQGNGSPFLPGIVHDFDLLQVVNELRAAHAEAIAIRGADASSIRVTGFTPIRCAGPVIYVNGEAVAAPYRIEAIGSPESLASAMKMADGIVDKLSSLFPVKVRQSSELKLPAVEKLPNMHIAKVG